MRQSALFSWILVALLTGPVGVFADGVKTENQLTDPVSILDQAIKSGSKTVRLGSEKEFLTDILKSLQVPVESQVLVFSKSSLQTSRIDPKHPRALYYSDDVYIGWVQGGMVEVISHDPKVGPLFFAVERIPGRSTPRIMASEDCLGCHEGSRTRNVPGVMIRSLFTAESGQPILAAGSHLTDHSSPIEERWGGWYVTGMHGDARHMGNVVSTWVESTRKAAFDSEKGANIKSLDSLINTEPYLRDDSDIVALMVLEHQVGMLNRLTEASHYFTSSLRISRTLYPDLTEAKTADDLEGSSASVAQSYAEKVIGYMLFCDEAALPEDGIDGRPDFQNAFQANARKSAKGDSLKDFHLLNRMFKNRCSYMIYSSAFQSLHPALKDVIYRRLWVILDGQDETGNFDHLTLGERRRIVTILRQTLDKSERLPECWNE